MMMIKKYASHLEQDKLPVGNRPANWNYEIGVVLMGFERLAKHTGDNTYMDYTKHIIDHFIKDDGTIRTYIMDEYNSDMVPPGRQLLRLHEIYKDEKYKLVVDKGIGGSNWWMRSRSKHYLTNKKMETIGF